MKTRYFFFLAAISLLLFLVSGCDPSNRADFEKLISPGYLPYLKPGKMMQVTSHDTSGGDNDMILIPAGKKATILDVSGPGVITRIWFRVKSNDPYYLRRILIRMYWDEEKDPSVEVPLGDFFGNGFSYKQYNTAYLSMAGGGFTCFFPMPFEKSAKIEIINETGQEIPTFGYQVNYLKMDGYLGRDVAYFHAWWNRNVRTDYDSSYTILRVKGKGHIVGVNLNIQSFDGKFTFLDGDEKIYIDGEKNPSLYGTGTEDFFSGGDNFNRGEFIGPYNGLIMKDDSLGRIAAYRFNINDPIPFKKSIKFTIEHGPNNQVVADYSSTIYWYQIDPHNNLPFVSRSGQRIPLRTGLPGTILEAEKMNFSLGAIPSLTMDMSDYGCEWSGSKQLLINCSEKDIFSVTLPAQKEATYSINLYYTQGPDYGNIGIYQGEKRVAGISGYSRTIRPGGKISIPLSTAAGLKVQLKFVVEGKNELSSGYKAGFDGFGIEPERTFIPEWFVIGPFENTGARVLDKRGIDSVFPPESAVNLKAATMGKRNKFVHWNKYLVQGNGFMDLARIITPHENSVAYAVTYLYSKEDKEVALLVGSSCGMKVLFNNRELYRFDGERIASPDQAEIRIRVRSGWNKLLIKTVNSRGGLGFYARIRDFEKNILLSPDQKIPPKM